MVKTILKVHLKGTNGEKHSFITSINLTEDKAHRHYIGKQMEQQRKIVEYYNGCMSLKHPRKPKNGIQDVVFIKDGHLVGFARFEPKQGGIYAANNEEMPNYKWTPHKWLSRLRDMNKAFYREVKKAAFASPKEWFNFAHKTAHNGNHQNQDKE